MLIYTCNSCHKEKELGEFSFRNLKKKERIKRCKECVAVLTKQHYKKHKEEYQKSRGRTRLAQHLEIQKLKESSPCADCSGFFPYYVMDFDHREDQEKIGNVSQLTRIGSGQLVKDEIKKCDLVCSNCHRIRTFQRKRSNSPS